MSRATRMMSSAIHAPCVQDVIAGGIWVHCNRRENLRGTGPHAAPSFPLCSSVSPVVKEGLWLLVLLGHARLNLPTRQARRDFVSRRDRGRILDQLALSVENQRIAPIKNRQRRKGLKRGIQSLGANPVLQQHVPRHREQSRSLAVQLFANSRKHQPQIAVAHSRRNRFPAPV